MGWGRGRSFCRIRAALTGATVDVSTTPLPTLEPLTYCCSTCSHHTCRSTPTKTLLTKTLPAANIMCATCTRSPLPTMPLSLHLLHTHHPPLIAAEVNSLEALDATDLNATHVETSTWSRHAVDTGSEFATNTNAHTEGTNANASKDAHTLRSKTGKKMRRRAKDAARQVRQQGSPRKVGVRILRCK